MNSAFCIKCALVAFNLFFCHLIFAQTGSIQGRITELFAGSTEPVIGAIVNIEGASNGTTTDTAGYFTLGKITPGTYNIKISYIGYASKIIKDVMVESDKATNIGSIRIEETNKTMDEVVITGTRVTSSEVSVIHEIKKLDVVASGISNQQIKRTLDRDAADVAKRVSGVTVVDNRFIIIRGLSERYNAIMLNNTLAPSFEQDVKSFSLDNVPSQFIDRMVIYKSPSADLPGDFAGGVVKVYTHGMPEKNYFNIGLSGSYRQGTTYQDFKSTPSGQTSWLGYDDGTYSHPKGVPPDYLPGNPDVYDAIKIGKLFRNDTWVPVQSKANPDVRFNLNSGFKLNLGGEKVLGIVSGVSYSNTYQKWYDSQQALFVAPPGSSNPAPVYANYLDFDVRTVRLNAIQNFILQLDAKNSVEFKNLYTHAGINRYRNAYYSNSGVPKTFYTDPERVEYNSNINLSNSYGGIYSTQTSGKHTLFNHTDINWLLGYARADRDEPDMKNYQFNYFPNKAAKEYLYKLTSPNPANFGRLFFKTQEDVKTTSADITNRQVFDILGETELSLKGGWYLEEKRRILDVRGYGYGEHIAQPENGQTSTGFYNDAKASTIAPEDLNNEQNWNNYNGLVISPSGSEGSYTANTNLYAYYGMAKLNWREKVNISGGMRLENYTQVVLGFKQYTQNWLPSVNVSYNFSKKILVRGSYGKTVNRMELRESSNSITFDYYTRLDIKGNNQLKPTNINNYDLRLEYYPTPDEAFSIGFFYKELTNPIERIYVNNLNGYPTLASYQVNYINAYKAYTRGIELEARKSLRNILILGTKDILRDFSVLLNTSIQESRVLYRRSDLPTSGIFAYTSAAAQSQGPNIDEFFAVNNTRSLFAQSPYLVNAALTYNNEKSKTMVNLSYNIIGKRLFAVIPGVGTIYEIPRHVVDITLVQGLGRMVELKFGIQDLINQKIQFVEDINNDGKVKRIAETGYVNDPSKENNIYNAGFGGNSGTVGYSLEGRPANATDAEAERMNYNQGDIEYLGFRRGRYYSIGITLKLDNIRKPKAEIPNVNF